MQKTAYKIALLTIILFLSCGCTDDSGMVEFGTFYSAKYFRITVKYLSASTTIQGYPCKRGKVRFHFNDSLLSFRSTAEIKLVHGSIPAGSRIYLYNNGTPENILLSADTEIQGYGISGQKSMQGYQLTFYNGGELWRFKPLSDEKIDGILCSHNHEIELYPDGSLMCCHLAGDIQGREHHFPAGTRILLDREGNIHPYSFPIHAAIARLMNIGEHFSEPLMYAYHKRLEGKVDSVQNMFRSNRNDRNPLIHYEMARIKRHLIMGGADEDIYSYLNSSSRSWVDPYNVIMAFSSAESHLYVEENKEHLREEHWNDNYYFSAIDGFESVLEMKPDYHAARLHLVDLYSHLTDDLGGDREKAVMHALELLKYDTAWAARAEAILLPEEQRLLDFWLGYGENYPNNPMVQQELGRAYLADGDVTKAEECFRRAMELEQAKCTVLVDLARHHIRQVRRDKMRSAEHSSLAEGYLLEYMDTDPVNPHMAWCYAKLAWLKDIEGESEEGATLLEMARDLDMRFSREEAPPSLMLFIPLGEVFHEFESYFSDLN